MRILFYFLFFIWLSNDLMAQWKPVYLKNSDTAFLKINGIQEYEGSIYVFSKNSGPALLSSSQLKPLTQGLDQLSGTGLISTNNGLFYLGNDFYKFSSGQWQKLNSNFNPLFISVYSTYNNDIIAGTAQNGLFYYSSTNNQWTPKNIGLLDNRIKKIHSNDSICAVLTGNNQVYLSFDSANTWNRLNINDSEIIEDIFVAKNHLVFQNQNQNIKAIILSNNSIINISNSDIFIKNKQYFFIQNNNQIIVYNDDLVQTKQLLSPNNPLEIFDFYKNSDNWYLASSKGLYQYDSIENNWINIHNGGLINQLKKIGRGDYLFAYDSYQIYKIQDSLELIFKSNHKIIDVKWINSAYVVLTENELIHLNNNGQLIANISNNGIISIETNPNRNEIYFIDTNQIQKSTYNSPLSLSSLVGLNSTNPFRKVKKMIYSNSNLYAYGDSGLYKLDLNNIVNGWQELDSDNKIRTRKVLDLIVINDKLIVKPGIGCLISYDAGMSFEDYYFNPLFRFVNSLAFNDSIIWAQGNEGIIFSDTSQLEFKDFQNTRTISEPALMNDFIVDNNPKVWASSESGIFTNDLQQILYKSNNSLSNTKIYPNPFKEYLIIETESEIKWTVFDTQGKAILQGNEKELELKNMSNKLIFIRIESKSGIEVHKLIHID